VLQLGDGERVVSVARLPEVAEENGAEDNGAMPRAARGLTGRPGGPAKNKGRQNEPACRDLPRTSIRSPTPHDIIAAPFMSRPAVIGVARNDGKGPLFSSDERVEIVRERDRPSRRARRRGRRVCRGCTPFSESLCRLRLLCRWKVGAPGVTHCVAAGSALVLPSILNTTSPRHRRHERPALNPRTTTGVVTRCAVRTAVVQASSTHASSSRRYSRARSRGGT